MSVVERCEHVAAKIEGCGCVMYRTVGVKELRRVGVRWRAGSYASMGR